MIGNYAKLAAVTLIGFWFLRLFERLSWVVLRRARDPGRGLDLGLARADEPDRERAPGGVSRALVRLPGARVRLDSSSACRTCSSSRSSSGPRRAGRCVPTDLGDDDRVVRDHDGARGWRRLVRASAACPRSRSSRRLPGVERRPAVAGAAPPRAGRARAGGLAGTRQQRHRLDVRRVREHVHRPHALELGSRSRRRAPSRLPPAWSGCTRRRRASARPARRRAAAPCRRGRRAAGRRRRRPARRRGRAAPRATGRRCRRRTRRS